jgi:hypothetical protein
MTKVLRVLMVAAMVVGVSFGAAAGAQDADVRTGDAEASADQSGAAASGDGVGGMVVGVVSAGDASVDATNLSRDVEIETGDAEAVNQANVEADLIPLIVAEGGIDGDADVRVGDAEASAAQNANAASGDGVAGLVAGVVTSAGGSADLALANTSEEVEVETGDAEFENDARVRSFQRPSINAIASGVVTP